jgi:hypothetical protein
VVGARSGPAGQRRVAERGQPPSQRQRPRRLADLIVDDVEGVPLAMCCVVII